MFVLRSLLLSTLLLALTAQAHDARPNYVQITETEANTFSVSWKVPSSVPGRALPYPTLPDDCVADRQPAWQQAGAEYIGQQVFRCEEGLSGRVVGINRFFGARRGCRVELSALSFRSSTRRCRRCTKSNSAMARNISAY
jgi:hypothetical protein